MIAAVVDLRAAEPAQGDVGAVGQRGHVHDGSG
jgi:hypothetical protein